MGKDGCAWIGWASPKGKEQNMQADQQGAFQSTRGADAEMGRILARGFAIGIPTAFALTMVICSFAGIGWSASAAVAAWGAVVGGPFFGVSLQTNRVSELDADATPIHAPTTTAPAEPPRSMTTAA
jgi:hypothetical protein